MVWMLCTLAGVSYAAVRSRINRLRRDAITETTERVLLMLSEARHADVEDLEALERRRTKSWRRRLRSAPAT